jgi:hypothetical protein
MSRKENREQIMSDEERITRFKLKGKRCSYCHGKRVIDTITDRLFVCCHKCAEWDNNAQVIKTSIPCICCGKSLEVERLANDDPEEFTVNIVDRRGFDGGMAARISCGYGSRLDGNVYMIAICDSCARKKQKEGLLTYVYNYIPNADGSPNRC